MGIEIERKFLVKSIDYKQFAKPVRYVQAYLASNEMCTVRLRAAGSQGYLTIKSRTKGISRFEFEYPVPVTDINDMFESFGLSQRIEKDRYTFKHSDGNIWEVDEFMGTNVGLVIAEIELKSEDAIFEIPDWVGDEVTTNYKYSNSSLVANPYSSWVKS